MKNLLNFGMFLFVAITIFSSCVEEEIIPVVETTITSDNAKMGVPPSSACVFTSTLPFYDFLVPFDPLKFPYKLQQSLDNCPLTAFYPSSGLCENNISGYTINATNVDNYVTITPTEDVVVTATNQEAIMNKVWSEAWAVPRLSYSFVSGIEIVFTEYLSGQGYVVNYNIYFAYAADSPLCL